MYTTKVRYKLLIYYNALEVYVFVLENEKKFSFTMVFNLFYAVSTYICG